MRILIADAFEGGDELRAAGHEVTEDPSITPDDLVDRIAGVHVLIVRSTKVTAASIDASDDLSLIVRAGAGTNTIDTEAAAARGIYVCNTPGQNAIAVAELALGLLLSLDRNIPDSVADLRAGHWDKKRYSKADGLKGRTLGIIGCGDIGLAFAQRARACEMEVLVVDKPSRDAATKQRIRELGITTVESQDDLLAQSDVVSLHVPANDATKGMVDADFLSEMKDGAWLLNTSRGEVVVEDALLDALDNRGMRAGLDVYQAEPDHKQGEWTSAVAQHPSVYGTHHVGASTEQAQAAIAAAAVEVVQAFARGEVINCVNLETSALGSTTLVIRHYDKVGALSGVFDVLKDAEINVEQMDNEIFLGAKAAVATMQVAGDVSDTCLRSLRDLDDVIAVSASPVEA